MKASQSGLVWCDGCNGYHPRLRLTVAESSALWSLAQVGLIITLGVLAVTVSYEYGDGNPREERRLLKVDTLRVIQAALAPVQRGSK